ncbi:hypothetical protein GCM10020000_06950 [Streptomyces olivoverticillatus]
MDWTLGCCAAARAMAEVRRAPSESAAMESTVTSMVCPAARAAFSARQFFWLDGDHADAVVLGCGRDSGEEAATADGDDDGVQAGDALPDFVEEVAVEVVGGVGVGAEVVTDGGVRHVRVGHDVLLRVAGIAGQSPVSTPSGYSSRA